MGKGFNNYMCKKFFHPASADNLKRVWIAQKKSEVEKKKQDELRTQYDREQELYTNKSILSKESKERLELNFMYEPPPGVKKIGEGGTEENGVPEHKFEWQRTWGNAPKESYLEKGDDFNEQPFGIQVCQAKCIKCGKYGHMNTDKRCPLYGKSIDHDAPIQNVDQNKLIEEMKAEGLAMRYSSWDLNKEVGPNHNMVEEEKGIDRAELLKTMSKEEKKKLLKKLKRMEKEHKKKDRKEKKRKMRGPGGDDSDEWQERGKEESPEKNGKSSERRKEGAGSSSERGREENTRERSRDKRRSSPSQRRPSPSQRRPSPSQRRSSPSQDRRRDRSVTRDGKKDRKRDMEDSGDRHREKKRDRSDSGDRHREKRQDGSDSKERRRERPGSRDRKRDREERRRERS